MDCIVKFRKLYPDVSFRIFYIQDKNDLNEYDLCISYKPPHEKYNESKCLITEKLHLMVAATHPLASKPFVRFGELKEEEFAFLDKNSSLWHHTLHLCHQAGFEPRISMVGGDLHCMIKYISAGMAVTMGPEIAWRGIKDDSMVFVPTMPQEIRSTYVFWNGLKNPSRLRETFLNFLVEYFTAQVR